MIWVAVFDHDDYLRSVRYEQPDFMHALTYATDCLRENEILLALVAVEALGFLRLWPE